MVLGLNSFFSNSFFGEKPKTIFIKVSKTKQPILASLLKESLGKEFEYDLRICSIREKIMLLHKSTFSKQFIDHSRQAHFKASEEIFSVNQM